MHSISVACRVKKRLMGTNPEEASRPARECLAALEEANGHATRQKVVSLTDPSSTWTAANRPAFFAYSTNYLIDLVAGIIADVEASAVNKTAEVEATKTMIERVEERFDMKLVILVMVRLACLAGWWKRSRSRRMFRYGTSLHGMTAPSQSVASSGMSRPMNTAVRKVMPCATSGVLSKTRASESQKRTPSFILPASMIARHVQKGSWLPGHPATQDRPQYP